MVDKKPRTTSKYFKADLQTQGTTVSARTIRRLLNEMGCYGRRPRRSPLLTQRHKKARLEFAKTYLGKPKSFWENVLWTDVHGCFGVALLLLAPDALAVRLTS